MRQYLINFFQLQDAEEWWEVGEEMWISYICFAIALLVIGIYWSRH